MSLISNFLNHLERERERERERNEKQEQTICFFMTLSHSLSDISARRKIEL